MQSHEWQMRIWIGLGAERLKVFSQRFVLHFLVISALQWFRWEERVKKKLAKLLWIVFVWGDRRIDMRQKRQNFPIKIWNWFRFRVWFVFRASYVRVSSSIKNHRRLFFACLCIHHVFNASAAATCFEAIAETQQQRTTISLATAAPAPSRSFERSI